MNKTKAFTFIELIVSVTIMAIIGTSGMFYFHEFIGKKELLTHINSFENVIGELDYQVKKQDIFDYQLELEKNTFGYTISKNNIGTDFTQEAIFDSLNNSGSINIIENSSEIWEIKVYQSGKKVDQITRNGSDNISIELKENTTITSSLSGSKLNTLSFNYFTQEEDDNFVILDILDNNMTSYDSLTIRNISGRKSYLDESSQINNLPIILLFEQNGIEERLKLN